MIPVIILLLFINNAAACPLLEKNASFSSKFKQTRQIQGLKKSIESSGNFSVDSGKNVVWETLKPFYSKVVISKDGMMLEDQAFTDGLFKELSSILLKLHSGDLKTLEEKFTFKCSLGSDKKYHLAATPNNTNLAKIFKQIEIIGTTEPEIIILIDARGDQSKVEFYK